MHEKLILPKIRLECYEEIEIIVGYRRGWMKQISGIGKKRKSKFILVEPT